MLFYSSLHSHLYTLHILSLGSLAWFGEEDGSHLLSLFAHPTLYILFQVQAGSKARIGAEASFLLPMYGKTLFLLPCVLCIDGL